MERNSLNTTKRPLTKTIEQYEIYKHYKRSPTNIGNFNLTYTLTQLKNFKN